MAIAPAIAIASAVIGAATTVYGAFTSAAAQRAQGKMLSQQSQAQAQAAAYNAQLARNQAAQEEAQHRLRVKHLLSKQGAGYGASGLTLEGSPLEVMEETAYQAELDALTIRRTGENKARMYEWQGGMASSMAPYYEQAGESNAFSTLLTGFGSAARQGINYFAGSNKSTYERPIIGRSGQD